MTAHDEGDRGMCGGWGSPAAQQLCPWALKYPLAPPPPQFNVVARHVLVVTRAFESQQDPLNANDLGSAWKVLQVGGAGVGRVWVTRICE